MSWIRHVVQRAAFLQAGARQMQVILLLWGLHLFCVSFVMFKGRDCLILSKDGWVSLCAPIVSISFFLFLFFAIIFNLLLF